MKIGKILKPNKKGQIVIPKDVRDELGINQYSTLNLLVRDDGFYVHPITNVGTTKAKTDNAAFLKMLKETQGAWGPASKEEIKRESARRKLELQASARARNAW